MENNNKLEGLSGWLVLLGIGILVAPIRLLVTTIPVFRQIFTDGSWEALTTVGSATYNSLWGPILVGEIVYNIIILIASVYLIYLFFSKHYLFPRIYIIIIVVSFIMIPLDAWIVSIVMPSEPMFDPETIKELARAFISGLIWIPYILTSERVKFTFIEKIIDK